MCRDVVLLEERALRGLLREIIRQVLAGDQLLERIGQQQALGALAPLVIVHDAALEALVDEVVVLRIARRLRGRRGPRSPGSNSGRRSALPPPSGKASCQRDRVRVKVS